jgi:hypothetical protein
MVPMHLPKTVIKLPVRVTVEVEAPEPFTAERLTERPTQSALPDDSLQRRLAQAEDMIAWLVAPAEDAPEPTPEPTPEHHFADLMLADETADDARARLSARLKELRHYLMAPEIRVNEDGSLGLTGEEQSELQDLERRQTLGRWLDA